MKISLDLKKRFEEGVTRGEEFFARDLSTQTVEYGRLEKRFLNLQIEDWPRFHQIIERAEAEYPTFRDLMSDLYFSLYLPHPNFVEADQMAPSHKTNHQLMTQTRELPIYEHARTNSALSKVNTMVGLVTVAETLLQQMPEEVKQQAQQEQQQQEQQQQDVAAAMGAAQAAMDDGDEEGLSDALDALNEALEAQSEGQADEDRMGRIMKNALKQANEKMEEMDAMIKTWGTEPGEISQLSPEKVLELYERMRKLPSVDAFVDQLGRMQQTALEANMELHAREAREIVDVTTGRMWNEALPNEKALMDDDMLQYLLWSKLANDAMLTWMYAGREQAGKGPFVVCLDVSGSTSGQRQQWGKGFTLAAMKMAERQKRDVAVIMFDATVQPEGVFTFKGGHASLSEKIAVAEYFTGGGTNFTIPLGIALENIEAKVAEWEEADIVLVTDGEYTLPDDFVKDYNLRCEKAGIRTHGVLLDHSGRADSLEKVCEQIVSVQSLQGAAAAKPLFSKFVGIR